MNNKNKIGIEYVCTGNGGRSPTAETIGKDYVKQCGLEDKIRVYSSGTAAEMGETDLFQFPVNFLLEYIEIALNSKTYMGKARSIASEVTEQKERIALAVETGDTEAKDKVGYCVRYLMADEVAKRNTVLLEIGLVPEGHFHQQTRIRDDVDLILPMKKSNADSVERLYEDSEHNPKIIPICKYTGIDGDINDPFGGTIDDFRKTRDFIGYAVRKSIDKAVEEYME